jgi:3-hydroxy acid dehydrogenase / malonic semialdehyde reductase
MGNLGMTIMVTGATSGIGKATAIKFAANDYNVIITGRRKERLDDLEKELHTINGSINVLSLNFDVRNRKEVNEVLGTLTEEWKMIDILVNNAGLAVGLGHVDSGDVDDWERMIDTNIKGLLYVTRMVSPLMVERGKGHIINLSSIAGKNVYENGNVYCATKFAVDALSRTMRIDFLKHNIKVTNIAPGMVETEFSVVRFKGDSERAKNFYKGIQPLSGEDIADLIFYCATLPQHVCINDVIITPTQQADGIYNYRR